MIIAELLCADDTMQVRLHELLYEINFFEGLHIGWAEDVEDGDDVLVTEVA